MKHQETTPVDRWWLVPALEVLLRGKRALTQAAHLELFNKKQC